MICKNCGKELEAEEIICTQCNYDNTPVPEETATPKVNPWKIAFPVTGSICLLLVLSFLLHFGVMGYWIPRGNNINFRDSYTVDAGRLEANRENVVATLGKNKLTNAQLQVFYRMAQEEYTGKYSSKTPLDQQYYDENTGLTWQQYLLENSLNVWKHYRILTDMALEAGFALPEELQNSLDGLQEMLDATATKGGYASADEMLSKSVCEGCTVADYRYYLGLYYYANLYFREIGSKIEVNADEVEAYFAANEEYLAENGITKDSGILVDFRQILIMPESSPDGVTPGQWQDCKNAAEKILNQWLSDNPSEESFSALAAEKSDDGNTKANGGLMANIYKDYLTAVDIRHILIMPEGGTTGEDGKTKVYSDKEWEECRKKAQEIYNQYLAGSKTEESFSELAKKHSQDGNASEGGIYTEVLKGEMVEEFDSWIFDESRKAGDTGLIKTQYGYHIMYFVNRDGDLDAWAFDTQRKPGDYAMVKSRIGYHIVYFVESGDGWYRISEKGAAEKKADDVLAELMEENKMNTNYRRIRLAQE